MERCPLTIPLYTRMPKRLYTATGNDVPRQSIIKCAVSTLSVLSHPFLTEGEHAKGRLEVQKVIKNFVEYQRFEKEKQEQNMQLHHGLRR